MANVTTRGGDSGYTGLLGPGRVPKYDARIEALGAIDEATSSLGLARASTVDETSRAIILEQQRTLYRLMAEIATTPEAAGKIAVVPIGAVDLEQLERAADDLKRQVDIGSHFVIPGETLAGATLDVARTVVRRAERQVARMVHDGVIPNPDTIRYLNRLSDLLFILARFAERGQSRGVA